MTMKFTPPEFSTEFNILTKLIRPTMDDNTFQSLADLMKNPVDWQEFLRLVDRHRVVPLVSRGLNRCQGFKFPEQVHEMIQTKTDLNRKRALQQTAELIRLSRLFEENGICAISLKGPVLAKQVYGDVGMRHAGDLDFLINKKDIVLAKAVLANHNFLFSHIRDRNHEGFDSYVHHFNCVDKNSKILIEVHWKLLNNLYKIKLDEIHKPIQSKVLGNHPVYKLPEAMSCLYLILHGAQHAWMRLKWLCDIAELVHQNKFQLNREQILINRISPLIQQTLWLLDTIFNIQHPDLDPSNNDRHLFEIYHHTLCAMQSERLFHQKKSERLKYNLLLNNSMRSKLIFFSDRILKKIRNQLSQKAVPHSKHLISNKKSRPKRQL